MFSLCLCLFSPPPHPFSSSLSTGIIPQFIHFGLLLVLDHHNLTLDSWGGRSHCCLPSVLNIIQGNLRFQAFFSFMKWLRHIMIYSIIHNTHVFHVSCHQCQLSVYLKLRTFFVREAKGTFNIVKIRIQALGTNFYFVKEKPWFQLHHNCNIYY